MNSNERLVFQVMNFGFKAISAAVNLILTAKNNEIVVSCFEMSCYSERAVLQDIFTGFQLITENVQKRIFSFSRVPLRYKK